MIWLAVLRKIWPYAAGMMLACVAVYGIWNRGHHAADVEWQGRWDAREAALQIERAKLRDERQTALAKVNDDAIHQTVQLQADAAAAANAADGLRDAAVRAARRECAAGHPPAASSSAPAPADTSVLADVLDQLEAHGRAVAQEADRRAIAGAACEQSYDALNPTSSDAR